MAGYKMPIVCKDVFIPYSFEDSGITLDQYKEKYGIDLRDYFEFGIDTNDISIKPSLNKYYIVCNGFVMPLVKIYVSNSDFSVLTGVQNYTFDSDTEVAGISFEGFQWDYQNKTLQSYSF